MVGPRSSFFLSEIIIVTPELWFAIVGAAVTLGINLQKLSQVRADVKSLRDENNTRHTQNLGRFSSIDRRLLAIELAMKNGWHSS
jgi:hypothetical protein